METISFDYDAGRNVAGGELMQKMRQQQMESNNKSVEEKIISQAKVKEILQQCHICRQNILASEMNKHLKTCLGTKKKNTGGGSVQEGEEVDLRQHL